MSRGRGGSYKEHPQRHKPPHLQVKENYYRQLFPRADPEQIPNQLYSNSPGCPSVPLRSPSSLLPSAPPIPNHINVANSGAFNSSNYQNQGFRPTPNSFQHNQAEFLRGQISEAPQFRSSAAAIGSRPPNYTYQPQPHYNRYTNPNSSPRNDRYYRGCYRQVQNYSFPSPSGSSQDFVGPRHLNQNQSRGVNHQPSNRQTNLLCDNFQRLSFQQDRGDGKRSDRRSSSGKYAKGNITVTPVIQEQVHKALKADEAIPAKVLAKKLHLPKKVVNQALYSLERSKKASKQGLLPPEWTLYRENSQAEARISAKPQSPPSLLSLSSNQHQSAEAKVDIEKEQETKEEDSDSESSSSCSSLESSASEDCQSSAIVGCQENPCVSPADLEFSSAMMADQKEKVLNYLFELGQTTALVLAKKLGLRSAKQINPTIYDLEKQGDVIKNDTIPYKWELSPHRKERMERSLKAASIPQAGQMEVDVNRDQNEGGALPGLEPIPKRENWTPDQPQGKMTPSASLCEDNTNNESQWANDSIPDYLNAIRRHTDAIKLAAEKGNTVGTVAVSLAAPPSQNLWAKLQEVRLKNPVSGLMEYAQYLGQSCEFLLLDQSGPSHDPRFRMQVMLNGRLFPIAEASNKKVAKKDAAAATLRILIKEMQGGESTEDEDNTTSMDRESDQLPDPSGSVENTQGGSASGGVEGAEGPRQPLSRSLPGGKNPVSVLMEYSQRSGKPIEFIATGQTGPPHDPRFKYRVKVGENMFAESSAPSKKAARQLAAEEAVKELMADGKLQLNKPLLPLGLSGDCDEGSSSGAACPSLPPLTADELRAAHEAGVGDLINHLNNNAVSGLLEYARARGFAAEIRLVGQSGPPHEPKFTYQAKLGGRWFPPVCASNKKQGKQEAADAALRVLIGEAERAARTGELIPSELPVSGSTLHDQIAMLSHQRFNALTTRIQHCLLGRKILATIVMRRGEGLGTVVSLGTGNRCVKGEELSLKGETVNDCHAEIISRRGFIRFLYNELLKYYDGADDSIFEPADGNKLQLKSDITFHLYISTAPCGDGALFDKSCSETGDEVQGHSPLFENIKQGKLRTKVENGEGTIPVESSDIVPTWDGIQHGERLRTMSCSDKILRWNVLGLQGALLTHFLHPIYLKSITLGYLYSHGHLTRAVCCRLARDGEAFAQSLPHPFTLNHPEVGRVSVYDSTRHTGKTKESSVNWSLPDQYNVEVLDGTKGKLDGNKQSVSRVSKSRLFCLFRSMCQKSNRADLLSLPSYAQAKISATSFQLAKQHFFQALSLHGYGAWIGKPLEEKSFESVEGTGNNGACTSVEFGGGRNEGAVDYKPAEA
uniref:Adenosine deaminase RNA specific n=1 Tax=Oryzias sinensis TaxID=183150 RepID=A0A8C7YJU0_9TELE